MCETVNIINGRANRLILIRFADSFIAEYAFEGEQQMLLKDAIDRVKFQYPIVSKIWTTHCPYLRDGTFFVLCNDREVASYTLKPDDNFLECIEECLMWVMGKYHSQIRELEFQQGSWWRRALSGRPL